MPHDHDEKPPPPEAPPAFDFDKLPRWRSKIFSAPDDAPAEPAPQKPAPAPARETAQEFDPDMLPRVRPQFRATTDNLGRGARCANQHRRPHPARQPVRTGERKRSLSGRTNPQPGPMRAGNHSLASFPLFSCRFTRGKASVRLKKTGERGGNGDFSQSLRTAEGARSALTSIRSNSVRIQIRTNSVHLGQL